MLHGCSRSIQTLVVGDRQDGMGPADRGQACSIMIHLEMMEVSAGKRVGGKSVFC